MLKQKCYFFFSLPLTEVDFRQEYTYPQKDFVRLFKEEGGNKNTVWARYQEVVIDPFLEFQNFFTRHGVRFVTNGTFCQFIDLINSQRADVLLLVTHCKDGGLVTESLEFFDKLVSYRDILTANLASYPLVLDFSVCRPLLLKREIDSLHPYFNSFISETEKDLPIWLMLYAEIFTKMIEQNCKYVPAFLEVLRKYY